MAVVSHSALALFLQRGKIMMTWSSVTSKAKARSSSVASAIGQLISLFGAKGQTGRLHFEGNGEKRPVMGDNDKIH